MKIEYFQEKLMNLLLKARKRIFSIGIILLTLIIALIIYRTQTSRIESLRIKKDAEQKKNEVLREISRSEKTIKLYKNLLSPKDTSSIMDTLSEIARDSNVSLISIRPDREENQPLYIKTSFILVIGADSYHAIGKFISSIENTPEVYFVDAINIRLQKSLTPDDKELALEPKPVNKLNVNLTLSIIAFKG